MAGGLYILIGGVDQSAFYQGASLKIREKTGSDRSTISLVLENPDIAPIEGQPVVIWDTTDMRRKEATGRVQRAPREVIGKVNGHAKFKYAITIEASVKDLSILPPITTTYANKTTGFMFRDVLTRAPGFDVTNVTLGGSTQKDFNFRHSEITSALDRIAAIEGWQWWVDYDQKVYFTDPFYDTPVIEVNDSNWDTLSGMSLKIEPDISTLANQIRLFYESKYIEGTVSVFNASNQITGVGTEWLRHVVPGAKFRLGDEYEISYTVQEVVSDTTIQLSSNYNEGTLAGQTYVIEGVPRATQRQESSSVAAMAAITGGTGIYHRNIDFKGAYLTYEEARDLIGGMFEKDAYPKVNISMDTNSELLGIVPNAGQPVKFTLTDWGIDTILQIRDLSKDHIGGYNTSGYPVYNIKLKFQEHLYDLAAELRRKKARPEQTSPRETNLIDEIFTIPEFANILENVSAVIVPYISSENAVASEDVAGSITDVNRWAPFVWGPSIKEWTSGSDWGEWSLTNLQVNGASLEFSGAQLSGEAMSPWLVQYCPNSLKTDTLTATVPGGCAIGIEWRTSETHDGVNPTAWSAGDIATIADAKYMQVRLVPTRTTGAEALSVDSYRFEPYKNLLKYNRTYWMGWSQSWDTAAEWSTWTLVNLQAISPSSGTFTTDGALTFTTDGGDPFTFSSDGDSLILTPGSTSGSATSPWIQTISRMVAKTFDVIKRDLLGTGIALYARTCIDEDEASASQWFSDPRDATEDRTYMQLRFVFTQTVGNDEIELQKLTVRPR